MLQTNLNATPNGTTMSAWVEGLKCPYHSNSDEWCLQWSKANGHMDMPCVLERKEADRKSKEKLKSPAAARQDDKKRKQRRGERMRNIRGDHLAMNAAVDGAAPTKRVRKKATVVEARTVQRVTWTVQGRTYPTKSAAAKAVGVSPKTIMRWCKGYTDSHGVSVPRKENCWCDEDDFKDAG